LPVSSTAFRKFKAFGKMLLKKPATVNKLAKWPNSTLHEKRGWLFPVEPFLMGLNKTFFSIKSANASRLHKKLDGSESRK
jgi:hypothetical protein